MASSTRARVVSSTLAWPFDTRETVCDETPARWATSAIDGRGAPVRRLLLSAMAPHVFKLVLAPHVSRALCSRKHPNVYANIIDKRDDCEARDHSCSSRLLRSHTSKVT